MDDLRELVNADAVFSVSADAEMAATFVVVYTDFVAQVYEHLIADSAEVLAGVPGVFEIVHEDREILLVRASPDVWVDGVTDRLRSFWSHAATPAPPAPRRRWSRLFGRR